MICFVFSLLSAIVVPLVQPTSVEKCKLKFCQYDSYEQNNLTGNVKFLPRDINVSLCTHIVYFGVSYGSNQKFPIIANNETELQQIVGLKATYPNLKVLLFPRDNDCIENDNIEIASNESRRNTFARNIKQYLKDRKFDGLVYGCMFLGAPPADPQVAKVLTNITISLNQAFSQETNCFKKLDLVLNAIGERIFDTYDIKELSKNVDWIILDATYLQGYWKGVTGHHSPLYPRCSNEGLNPKYSIDTAVIQWRRNKAPSDKLIITLPSYGVPFTLTSAESGVGAIATKGRLGNYPQLAYYEICGYLKNATARRHFIKNQGVPYLVLGNQWIGYDDVESLKDKIRNIDENNLAGFFFDSLHYDDFKGTFCGQGPYPLLKAIIDECLS